MSDDQVPCPHCGSDIHVNAKFCRHCGSSDSDGWKEDYDGDDEDEFDYDDYVRSEFPDNASDRVTNTDTKPIWRFVAVILLLAFLLGYAFF